MIPQADLDILQAYAEVARPVIRKHFGKASCIAATRATARVLNRFDLAVQPISVVARAYNAAYRACEALHGRSPRSQAELQSWQDEEGAHIAQVGNPRRRDGSGHLVAWVGEHTLVDAAIDQLDRPEFGLRLPSVLLAQAGQDFPRGAPVVVGVEKGATVSYRAVDGPNWYSNTEYWWSDRLDQAVEEILEGMGQPVGDA